MSVEKIRQKAKTTNQIRYGQRKLNGKEMWIPYGLFEAQQKEFENIKENLESKSWESMNLNLENHELEGRITKIREHFAEFPEILYPQTLPHKGKTAWCNPEKAAKWFLEARKRGLVGEDSRKAEAKTETKK